MASNFLPVTLSLGFIFGSLRAECISTLKATNSYKHLTVGSQMSVGETCSFLLQAPKRNQTLLFKLNYEEGQVVPSDYCWHHALQLYNGPIQPKGVPGMRSYCLKDSPVGNRYWYRSQGGNMTIVFTKSDRNEVLRGSYRIDDCECRQGPLCQRPCQCDRGYWGLCQARTCEAPNVENAAGIVQLGSTGLSEGKQYSIGSVISFYCVEGFRISGYNKLTCTPKGWFRVPPKCIANNFIQETFCKNKYIYPNFDPNLKYRTTVPPYKRVQALVSKVRQQYRVNTKLIFQCTNGYFMEKMYHMRVVEITCRDSGEWSIDPWPMCEEITCPTPSVQHAQVYVVTQENLLKPASHRVGVGTKLKYKCDYGYYMKGDSELVCQKFKYYKESVPECIDKDVFFNRCKRVGKQMKFDANDSSSAYCVDEDLPSSGSPVSLNTLTVVTAAAATVFGVLLLVILLVAYQRRRIIHEMRRLRQTRRDTAADGTSSEQPTQINVFQFILPSYDEAVQSTPVYAPPSFAEATGDSTVPNDADVLPPSHMTTQTSSDVAEAATGGLPVYLEDVSTSECIATENSRNNMVQSTSPTLADSCRLGSQSSGDSLLIGDNDEEVSLLG